MVAKRFWRLWSVVAIGATIHCKHVGASDVKHEFGRVAIAELPLDCEQRPTLPQHKYFLDYTRDILKFVLDKNRERLPSNYSSEKFCIEIKPIAYPNASAHSSGKLDINVGIIAATANDAQFASMISHELAHILNYHQAKAKPDLSEHKEYVETIESMKKLHPLVEKFRDELAHMSSMEQVVAPLGAEARIEFSNYRTIFAAYLDGMAGDELPQSPDNLLSLVRDESLDKAFLNSRQNFSNREYWPKVTLLAMVRDSRMALMKLISDPATRARFNAEEEKTFTNIVRGISVRAELDQLRRTKREYEVSFKGPEVANNWIEQEADEIGLEIYLRAGFAVPEMTNFFSNLRQLNEGRKTEGEALVGDEVSRLSEDGGGCFRGEGAHPALCWRIEDVRTELKKHEAEYKNIIADPGAITIFPGRLDEIRRSYQPLMKDLASEQAEAPKLRTHWCDPYKPNFCRPYCRDPETVSDNDGWAAESGESCVIRNSSVDFRI